MACLLVTEGPAMGRHFALEAHALVLVGRDDHCTFQIVDPQMSRRHFQIKLEDDRTHHLIDFGSTNGVKLNGDLVRAPSPLSDGDELLAGESRIIYSTQDVSDALSWEDVLRRKGQARRPTIQPTSD